MEIKMERSPCPGHQKAFPAGSNITESSATSSFRHSAMNAYSMRSITLRRRLIKIKRKVGRVKAIRLSLIAARRFIGLDDSA
jgi:hypothetical protein